MEVLLKLGLLIVAGLIGGRGVRFFNLPNVTGYLLLFLLYWKTREWWKQWSGQ